MKWFKRKISRSQNEESQVQIKKTRKLNRKIGKFEQKKNKTCEGIYSTLFFSKVAKLSLRRRPSWPSTKHAPMLLLCPEYHQHCDAEQWTHTCSHCRRHRWVGHQLRVAQPPEHRYPTSCIRDLRTGKHVHDLQWGVTPVHITTFVSTTRY